ncbi:hypothetical protein KQI63_10505 [bacterium]|nr:hypothetical protein [bacterium]
MNAAQLHLLVNHFPVIGMILALPVLLLARTKFGGRGAAIAAVILIVIASLGSVASVVTGEGAEEIIEDVVGIHTDFTHQHEERAEATNVVAIITGFVALLFLFMSLRKEKNAPVWAWTSLMIFVLITSILAGWTSHLGGQIRHTEIRPGWADAPNVDATETMKAVQSKLGDLINSSTATLDQKLNALNEMLEEETADSRQLARDVKEAVEEAGDRSDELLREIDNAIKTAQKTGENISDAVHEAIEEFEEHAQ